jgi:multidrug efflux pump subunit AcrB
MDFGGSEEEQVKGFKNQTVVLIISLIAIYLSLVYQFKNAIKPFVVFAAVPYGIAGGWWRCGSWTRRSDLWPFLGIISLLG